MVFCCDDEVPLCWRQTPLFRHIDLYDPTFVHGQNHSAEAQAFQRLPDGIQTVVNGHGRRPRLFPLVSRHALPPCGIE